MSGVLRRRRTVGDRLWRRRPVLVSAVVGLAATALAAETRIPSDQMPGPLEGTGFEQRLGAQLPLDTPFVDESGEAVVLGELFGERPVVLAFVYFECPMLCSLTLRGIAQALKVLTFDVGRELDVVAVSIDPGERPRHAAAAEAVTLERYGRPATAAGWHFLTGSEEAIGRLAAAAGFRYRYVPERDEYAHAAGLLVTTPDGVVAQHLYGVEFPPKDLRLALVEASEGRLGSLIDQVMLYCYRYDPALGRYSAATLRLVRLAGGFFVVGLGAFIWWMRRRERSEERALGEAVSP